MTSLPEWYFTLCLRQEMIPNRQSYNLTSHVLRLPAFQALTVSPVLRLTSYPWGEGPAGRGFREEDL